MKYTAWMILTLILTGQVTWKSTQLVYPLFRGKISYLQLTTISTYALLIITFISETILCGRNSVAERSEAAYMGLQNTYVFRPLRYWCHEFDLHTKHGYVAICMPLFCFPLYKRGLPTRRSPVQTVLPDAWSFTSELIVSWKTEKGLIHASWRF